MDFIMSQADRFSGNMHSEKIFVWIENGGVKTETRKSDPAKAAEQPSRFLRKQRLLETTVQKLPAPELDPKGADGKIARPPGNSNTVAAIEAFQSRSNISIDGVVAPGSQTWQALLEAARVT
jgi:peptidoglycan hydrolase-like protein with peptidoglycan-binding domain